MAAGWPGPGTTICVLGDAHLDVVVQLSGPVAQETDTPARTDVGVGGQAANVAAWIAGLGGRTRLIAAWGSDPAARLVADELTRRGVDLAGPVLDGRTGVVVSLSDRGRSVVDAALTDLLDRERALLAGLSEDQRPVLADLLRTLLVPFDSADQ